MEAATIVNNSGIIQSGDWVIWLDADEFLNIHEGDGRVESLIRRIEPHEGMLINWHCFGDSGQSRFNGRFISEEFIMSDERDYERNKRIKTLFRWKQGGTEFMQNPHRPYLYPSAAYKVSDFLNADGIEISKNFPRNQTWVEGVERTAAASGIFRVPKDDYAWSLAQINHYTVRTVDLYRLKKRRGRSHAKIKANGAVNRVRHDDEFYKEFNKNIEKDISILRFAQQTGTEMNRLLALPGVSEASEQIKLRTIASLLELEQ